MRAKLPRKENIENDDIKVSQKLIDELQLKRLKRENVLKMNVSGKDVIAEKQQKMIHFLKKDGDNLKKGLNLMTSERQCLMQSSQAEEITQLFNQADSLDLELAREKEYISDLEMKIRTESSTKKKMKNNFVGDYRYLELQQKSESNCQSMKSRLHTEHVQLGTVTAENAELRKRIENQLKEKARFNQVFEELLTKLKKGKIVLRDVVVQSKAQLTKRDEKARRIQALKDRDAADLKKRSEEMQDLNMKIFEDAALSRYKTRIATLRSRLDQTPKAALKVNTQLKKDVEHSEGLHDIWEKVKEELSSTDCKDVCEFIIRTDADNFSLFTYNNELRCQVEALTEKALELMGRLDDEEEWMYQREDDEERKKSDLERTLHMLEERVGVQVDELQTNSRMFERLLAKIKGLFDTLKCNPSPLQQLLGDYEEVTEFNFQLYLSHVESRLVPLLTMLPRVEDNITTTTNRITQGFTLNLGSPSLKNLVEDTVVVSRLCLECEEAKRKPAVVF